MLNGLCSPADKMLKAKAILKPLCFLTTGSVDLLHGETSVKVLI